MTLADASGLPVSLQPYSSEVCPNAAKVNEENVLNSTCAERVVHRAALYGSSESVRLHIMQLKGRIPIKQDKKA